MGGIILLLPTLLPVDDIIGVLQVQLYQQDFSPLVVGGIVHLYFKVLKNMFITLLVFLQSKILFTEVMGFFRQLLKGL